MERLIKSQEVQNWGRDGGYFSQGAVLSARPANISAQGQPGDETSAC